MEAQYKRQVNNRRYYAVGTYADDNINTRSAKAVNLTAADF